MKVDSRAERPTARAAFMVIGVAGVLAGAGNASAFQIDADNPDLDIRFDNTLRLNTGVRTGSRDAGIANNPAHDEDEYLFDRGDIINKRIDLLSEFDISWKKRFGEIGRAHV